MDWNKFAVLGAQTVVFLGLLAAVLCGHDSVITDAMMAVAGAITGVGIWSTLPSKVKKVEPRDITDAGK